MSEILMSEYEVKNAKITKTTLGLGDREFTFYLYLDYGGSGQGAGGRCMAEYKNNEYRGTAYGLDLIIKILEIVDVENWEELVGKHIRVDANHSDVRAIGNLLNDKWLNFDEHAKEFYP